MEIMEDGNLMDKVHILLQRDLEYYKNKQSVLQETICPGISGGRLDFPRYASFAAVKLVLWWEDEFVAGFRKSSGLIPKLNKVIDDSSGAVDSNGPIVKTSDPDKFMTSVAKSSEQLLEHLHVLTQEALDHADLTVLMGTLGAAVLIKNCLWFYIQLCTTKNNFINPMQNMYKQYQEMGEALAERLLDMHCRLVSLYILQDAESLDWENTKPFFESERGSYVIQMWWIYMQGTKQDLWNSIPPKMAQMVLAGMLNESLTILTVRYMQSKPSECRSKLLAVDISNLLLCIGQLLPCICNSTDEIIGLSLNSQSKILRDIHAKCQELFLCLLLRGIPLNVLYKVFRKGVDTIEIFRCRAASPSPWVTIALPHILPHYPKGIVKLDDLKDNFAIALEIIGMLAQPQPNWALLLKVLGMRNGHVLSQILNLSINKSLDAKNSFEKDATIACEGFLCLGDGSCRTVFSQNPIYNSTDYYQIVVSLTYVLLCIGSNNDLMQLLIKPIEKTNGWAQCLDRREVWNLNYPPWYKAIISLIKPLLDSIVTTVISAVQTGASMYQAMTIVLACFLQLWDSIDSAVPRVAFLLQEALPSDIAPIGKSTLLQMLVCALYKELLLKSEETKKSVRFGDDSKDDTGSVNATLSRQFTLKHKNSVCSFDGTNSSLEAVAVAVAEALCSIDEDDKHTTEIEELLKQAQLSLETNNFDSQNCRRVEQSIHMSEILVSDLLITPEGKKSLKIIYHFLRCNYEWLLQKLSVSEETIPFEPNKANVISNKLLHTMFHVGYKPFDQLLTGQWQPDWISFFHIPMGLSIDRVWNQVSMRWEFDDKNFSSLSVHDARIVLELASILKQI
ncbi:hypothetical protein RN001_005181 [Aquatica leii]|uniref:Uncharacterized protein n=1 Tax=Aquatica leii TaxID=1421715 RepID=A0AAN7PBL3_9COLE|nr:hypothetical protein RN001_005181 [Aquatica leii]